MFGVPPVSRTYWRSLAQIEERPEFRAALEREFPEGAAELPEGITRRDMMLLVGASLSLAGLAACRRPVEEIVPFVTAPEEMVPGIPRYYATTMPFGRSAYGLVVESHEGRPTKIEGNPDHPSSRGATDIFAQAAVLDLYDPDRAQSITHLGDIRTFDAFVGQGFIYGDLFLGPFRDAPPPPALVSTVKIRHAGFADCLDTEDMFTALFERFRRERLLP